MKKTKVVIASLLKPIDDTRMSEKFGLSMAETSKYDINIIGFDSKNARSAEHITYHPLKPFNRLSLSRLIQPWKVIKIYIKVKPQILIVNTHELLIVTSLYKILFGGVFLYDIRENYAKNVRNTKVFPLLIRPMLAGWIRLKEWCSKPLVAHYILAERIYEKQLPFLSKNITVIENKYAASRPLPQRQTNNDTIDLVFTGTIADSNGVFEAIDITKTLHALEPRIRLQIVGYCALKQDLIRLREEIKDFDFIALNGGDHLVPHAEIIAAIQSASFGFVLKKPNRGMNDEKLLTRIFEYTANQLPILLLNNPTWVSYCAQFNAAIVVEPKNFSAKQTLQAMTNSQFYTEGDTSMSLWKSEEPKLIKLLEKLTEDNLDTSKKIICRC